MADLTVREKVNAANERFRGVEGDKLTIRAGFSLFELLFALIIVAILGGVVVANLLSVKGDAERVAEQSGIEKVREALLFIRSKAIKRENLELTIIDALGEPHRLTMRKADQNATLNMLSAQKFPRALSVLAWEGMDVELAYDSIEDMIFGSTALALVIDPPDRDKWQTFEGESVDNERITRIVGIASKKDYNEKENVHWRYDPTRGTIKFSKER
ncbi:MAG: prepilin-type N-terminal cleavage/methylation domain-containing protein [Helicobacteraceae bacterium]|nr:prepilin-type N-terminal cleavage/methylation domain-containing protein [Helicobacteraceae bacterium]